MNVNQILPSYLVTTTNLVFGCILLDTIPYDNHSLSEPFEQILKSPQEANHHQTFTKASNLQGLLMFLRNPRRKSPNQLLLNRYLLHQDSQDQQSQRLYIVTEKQHQFLKTSSFKTMESVRKRYCLFE